jgi:hypothetical protein
VGHVTGAVYAPPSPDLPFVAVLFDDTGELLLARAVDSVGAGEHLLESLTEDCHELRFPEPAPPLQANDT